MTILKCCSTMEYERTLVRPSIARAVIKSVAFHLFIIGLVSIAVVAFASLLVGVFNAISAFK